MKQKIFNFWTIFIWKLKKDNGFLIHMYSATIEMIFLNSTVLGHNTGFLMVLPQSAVARLVDGTLG